MIATIGFVGLGKLGMPVATAIALRGFDVIGYDNVPELMQRAPRPFREAGPEGGGDCNDCFLDMLDGGLLRFAASLADLTAAADLIFLCIQTPHAPEYEGVTYAPTRRRDFDYSFLVQAVKDVVACATRSTTLAIISTVLPGTMRRLVQPLLPDHVKLVYTPQTPAMGTAMYDFLHSDFYIVGVDDQTAANTMAQFYHVIAPGTPVCRMSVASAELCKVVYNTYITMKIAYAQTLMEIAHRMNEDLADNGLIEVDDVINALVLDHKRLISPKYLRPGMHDGGGCHPRDLIALSYLSQRLGLSYDFFGELVKCREEQMGWIADLCVDAYKLLLEKGCASPAITILGTSFKKESNITTGSSALLVKYTLEDWGYQVKTYDPYVDMGSEFRMVEPGVVLIGMNHDEFSGYSFPRDTIVIDPFRYIPEQPGVTVMGVGRGAQMMASRKSRWTADV